MKWVPPSGGKNLSGTSVNAWGKRKRFPGQDREKQKEENFFFMLSLKKESRKKRQGIPQKFGFFGVQSPERFDK